MLVIDHKSYVARTLRAAAQRLCVVGWVQGVLADSQGRESVVGALIEIVPTAGPLFRQCVAVLQEHLAADIVTWNNTPGRTVTEVIDALNACASRIEAS